MTPGALVFDLQPLREQFTNPETWNAGNVVLVGDAAHTAHWSIGSGTRLALEAAVALAWAFVKHRDRTPRSPSTNWSASRWSSACRTRHAFRAATSSR